MGVICTCVVLGIVQLDKNSVIIYSPSFFSKPRL